MNVLWVSDTPIKSGDIIIYVNPTFLGLVIVLLAQIVNKADCGVSAVLWAASDETLSSTLCSQYQHLNESGTFLNSNFRFEISLTLFNPVLTTNMIFKVNEVCISPFTMTYNRNMSRSEVLMKCNKLAFNGFRLILPGKRHEFSRSIHSNSLHVLPHLLVPAVVIASLTSLQVQNIKVDR